MNDGQAVLEIHKVKPLLFCTQRLWILKKNMNDLGELKNIYKKLSSTTLSEDSKHILWINHDEDHGNLIDLNSLRHQSMKMHYLKLDQVNQSSIEWLLLLVQFIIMQDFDLIVVNGCLYDLDGDYPRLRWILEEYQGRLCFLLD